MSKSVLLSIRPRYCELIANGKKAIEVRKTRPKLETPFKCYIYCTQDKTGRMYAESQQVIGEFVCDKIYGIYYSIYPHDPPVFEEIGTLNRPNVMGETCLSAIEINDYLDGETGYGWHISDLQLYDKPRELSEFMKCKAPYDCCACDLWDEKYLTCGRKVRPPESWCYVEEYDGKC